MALYGVTELTASGEVLIDRGLVAYAERSFTQFARMADFMRSKKATLRDLLWMPSKLPSSCRMKSAVASLASGRSLCRPALIKQNRAQVLPLNPAPALLALSPQSFGNPVQVVRLNRLCFAGNSGPGGIQRRNNQQP